MIRLTEPASITIIPREVGNHEQTADPPLHRPDQGDVRQGTRSFYRDFTAQKIHFYKKNNRDEIAELKPPRTRSRATVAQPPLGDADLHANLLFVFYWLDIQVLEGALTAPRFVVGLHGRPQLRAAGDARAQAHHHQPVDRHRHRVAAVGPARRANLLLLGVSVSPGWAEKIHLYLAKKKLVTDQPTTAACAP